MTYLINDDSRISFMHAFSTNFDYMKDYKTHGIGAVSHNVDFSDGYFKINGKLYSVGSASPIKNGDRFMYVHKISLVSEPKKLEFEPKITCPYCKNIIECSFEMSDEDDDYECGRCGGIFSYERIVSVEYSSYPKSFSTKFIEATK
jgi:hypothetical protein